VPLLIKEYNVCLDSNPNTFILTPVKVIKEYEKYTAIALSEKMKPNTPIVAEGAYSLLSIMFNTEE